MTAISFPNESADYRRARTELLDAELALRAATESVAAKRRALPPGGAVPEDYVFEEGSPDLTDRTTMRTVKLSELFMHPEASLIAYSFMYGPAMAVPCPMCTCMIDSLNGAAQHAVQRVNLVVIAKSPIARIRDFARGRGWTNLRLLSSAANSYNRDYRGESETGAQDSMLNVFAREGGVTRHMWASEMAAAPRAPGQDPRHVDILWPLWNLFDVTREGRGSGWYPKLDYSK